MAVFHGGRVGAFSIDLRRPRVWPIEVKCGFKAMRDARTELGDPEWMVVNMECENRCDCSLPTL